MDENCFEGMWMVGGASHLERRVVLLSGHCEIRRGTILRWASASSEAELPPRGAAARKASADAALALALLLRFAMDLASALAELATISDQKTKIERYKAVLQDLLAQQHVAHLPRVKGADVVGSHALRLC